MTMKMFARVTSGQYSRFHRAAEQAHLLRILQSLLGTISDTQSISILYSHLSLVDMEAFRVTGKPGEMIALMLGDLTVDTYVKGTSANEVSISEAEQLHILQILAQLLDTMPWTQPSAAVYLRLCALADPARLSDDVRKKLAELIMGHYYQFKDNIKDIRPMLSAISSYKDLDLDKFSGGVAYILRQCATLPRAEFEGIHDKLRGALAAVAEYFGRPDAATLADHMTQDLFGWHSFLRLSEACTEIANVDKGLLSPEIVDVLERFSLLCPNTHWRVGEVRDNMKILCQLTRAAATSGRLSSHFTLVTVLTHDL